MRRVLLCVLMGFAKLPQAQPYVDVAIRELEKMQMTLTFTSVGSVTITTQLDGKNETSQSATWRRDERDPHEIVITSDATDIHCTHDGVRLLCIMYSEMTMVFTRR